jgi:hypothetical protein
LFEPCIEPWGSGILKTINALPPKEFEILDLKDKEDGDEDEDEDDNNDGDDGDDGMGIDVDEEEEDENKDEDILDNPTTIRGDDAFDDIGCDFQGTMKKLRGIAKVCIVAYKVRCSGLLDQFCALHVLCSKLIGRNLIVAVFKRKSSNVHTNSTNLSHFN